MHSRGIGLVYPLVALEQFGYGLGFTVFTVYLMYSAKGRYKTSHYAISTGIMALGMMLPGFVERLAPAGRGLPDVLHHRLLPDDPGHADHSVFAEHETRRGDGQTGDGVTGDGDWETRGWRQKKQDAGAMRMGNIRSHRELKVGRTLWMQRWKFLRSANCFPHEEKYSLTEQMRRSSRFVAAGIAEAWSKRRYEAAFKSKLNDSEAEASETADEDRNRPAVRLPEYNTAAQLDQQYEQILGKLVVMIRDSKKWTLRKQADS